MSMAGTGPSLSGAFDVLDAAGQDRLLSLQRRLKALRPGCRGAELLHAMVLLTLGQEAAARASLEALGADAVARLVAHRWAGADGNAEAPAEPPDVSWAVAQVYHLLAEEQLCPAQMRDVAYRAALRDFGSRDDPRLGELQEEAQNRCGGHVVGGPGRFQPLRSDLGCLPPSSPAPSGTRSLPRPIEGPSGWSRGRSLRSTGSPASLISNLEISQSPTMAVLSQPRGSCGPSKLGAEPPAGPACKPVPGGCQEPEEMSWPPSEGTANIPVSPPNSPVLPRPGASPDASPAGLTDPSEAPDTGTHYPVECTEVTPAPRSLAAPSTDACPGKDQMPLQQLPTEDRTVPTARPRTPAPSATETSPPDPSTSTPGPARPGPASPHLRPPPPELESSSSSSSSEKFYSFVVLHARADEHIALRVRETLEALGVPRGATFCEDFQVPGRGELSCLQDAIDHSAFAVLLLTANFDCRLSLHKVGHALMSSLTQHGRQDCVVPFLPLESSLAQLSPDTSGLLASLVWLDEHSKIFARKVASTFTPQRLRACRAAWKQRQDARALREQRRHLEGERQQVAALHAAYSAYLQSYLSWQAQMEKLQAAFGNHMTFGTQPSPGASAPYGAQGPLGAQLPFPSWPGHPPPPLSPWLAGSPPPACPQAPPGTPQSPGLQPLIIHHAQMVQLGLNNHMWNQRGAQAPEDKTQDAAE